MNKKKEKQFKTPEDEIISTLPTMKEATRGQHILAAYCNNMMHQGLEGDDASVYAYFKKLADLISDPDLATYICPLLLKAEIIVGKYSASADELEREIERLQTRGGTPVYDQDTIPGVPVPTNGKIVA